jgi:hypothetical protein
MRLHVGVLDPLRGVGGLVHRVRCGEPGGDVADLAVDLGDEVAGGVGNAGFGAFFVKDA